MSLITDWRSAVQTHLETQLGSDTVEVVAGERDGRSGRERGLVCVWFPGWQVIERDTSLAQPTLLIRYFPSKAAPTVSKKSVPEDPSPVEDAVMALVAAFPRASQVGGFFVGNLGCRLTSCTADYDNWRAEATLTAYTILEAA